MSELKKRCVEAVLRGEGSVDDITAKNNTFSDSILQKWIKCCNANMELKDYNPKREVYMAGTRRKTMQEERKEIVDYVGNYHTVLLEVALRVPLSWRGIGLEPI